MTDAATDVRRETESASGQKVLDDILSLLREERDAVLALDVARLREITDQKRELADRLAHASAERATPQERNRLLEEVRIRAEANALLMEDAAGSIAALLQCQVSAQTYDARARIQKKHGSFGGRIV